MMFVTTVVLRETELTFKEMEREAKCLKNRARNKTLFLWVYRLMGETRSYLHAARQY